MTRTSMLVETPRGSFVKRDEHGRVDFISPLPCPFHYGSIPRTLAPDGEGIDALHVSTEPVAIGAMLTGERVAWVRFLDRGVRDDKLVLAYGPLSLGQRASIVGFFVVYALAKRLTSPFISGGPTRFLGLELEQPT